MFALKLYTTDNEKTFKSPYDMKHYIDIEFGNLGKIIFKKTAEGITFYINDEYIGNVKPCYPCNESLVSCQSILTL